MPYHKIILEKRMNIGYLTLNRPEVFNAFDSQLILEIKDGIREVEADTEVKVLIITGAGKAFQSGADIGELLRMTPLEIHKWNRNLLENWRALEALKIPVIAAINGYALGGGLELALACDIRVASEKARLGLPEAKLGIVPGSGGTQRLPRLVGKGIAMEILLTGEPIDAQEAYRIGLVNKVVPDGETLKAAEEIANRIIKNAPFAVEMIKDAVTKGEDMPLDGAVEYSHRNSILCHASEDTKEGLSAFLEKRIPQWKGK